MTIWDAVEAKVDGVQVMEQVMVEAIMEDAEAVVSLVGVAPMPENLPQLRGMLTIRPLVMQMMIHALFLMDNLEEIED